MYVAKIVRRNLVVEAYFWKKQWHPEISSNQLEFVSNKNFLFKSSARKWIGRQLIREMLINKDLEIING